MRRLILFLGGLILMLLMFAALYLAGAIYETGSNHTIDTYFFQMNGRSTMRSRVPLRPSDLGTSEMRELLMRKFVYEYFYAVPDPENIARRMRDGSPMRYMTTLPVFKEWVDGVAAGIQDLAEARALRIVRTLGEIEKPEGSDYWVVNYELQTWYTPNDLDSEPVVTRGVMYISLTNTSEPDQVREQIDLEAALKSGRDPATTFNFFVNKIELH